MARDRCGSDYSENMSDATTCSCTASSVDKCSSRGCGTYQEPFFLHPPGSRPRDGIYVNPMTAYIAEPPRPKETAESFYLHSPQDLVYTRITRLFGESESKQRPLERKDETLTVKVDVHVNNGAAERRPSGNGYSGRAENPREPSEHAYEQICPRHEESPPNHGSATSEHKKFLDEGSECSRSRKSDRRYSRSSSASESSNVSSEIPCFSSSASTPSLSRNSSNERIGKKAKINSEPSHDKREPAATRPESEKESKSAPVCPVVPAVTAVGACSKPPPPPPPPPPPDRDDVVVLLVGGRQTTDAAARDERKNSEESRPSESDSFAAVNESEVSCAEDHRRPEVALDSPPADAEEAKASQTSHLVNRHMVLPFIPPKFANADSNTLLKPSEYLKSICKASSRNSLSKARSVDNLDIQGRSGRSEGEAENGAEEKESPPGPPPPPLSPLQKARDVRNRENGASTESESSRTPQPLATISIQDLTSIQLRRTNGTKANATKTFSAPPPRSVSMTNVSEPFFVQKTDLIAELKRTKDIPGIKKLKVERARVEKTQEKNLMTEISKAFSATNFVDRIPEKDSSGNVIPIWKRQMLARKAAERAKKELEERIAKENEERRQQAIPPWKRQLLAKKDTEEKRLTHNAPAASATSTTTPTTIATMSSTSTSIATAATAIAPPTTIATATATATTTTAAAISSATSTPSTDVSAGSRGTRDEERSPPEERKRGESTEEEDDSAQIIPWRAQLRKTNSKLNILD